MDRRQTVVNGWTVLHMPRRVAWSNYAEIREAMCDGLHACVQEHRTGIVVDLTGTALDDSSALVLLIRAGTRMGLLGYPMRLVVPNLSVQLRQVLHNLGIAAALPVFSSVHCAVAASLPTTAPADPAVLQHALQARQGVHQTADEPDSPRGPAAALLPSGDSSEQDLLIKVTSPDTKPLRLELGGTLTHGNIGHLGNVLTSFVDRSLHHLRIDSWPDTGHAGVLPILLGIRWRVIEVGGCLQLPGPPEWLRHFLRREGFLQTFTSCATCTRRAGRLATASGNSLAVQVLRESGEPAASRRTSAIDVTKAAANAGRFERVPEDL